MEPVSATRGAGGPTGPGPAGDPRESAQEVVDEVLREFVPASPVAHRILDVTVALIDERGEVAVRVQDIIEGAGVQVPILYRHFGSRDGVIQAAHVKRLLLAGPTGWTRFFVDVSEARTEADFRRVVTTLIDTAISPDNVQGRAQQANVIGAVYGRPRLRDAIGRLLYCAAHALAEILAPAQQQGWIRADLDLDAFGAWFGAQLVGRNMIEFDSSSYDGAAWDRIFRDAVEATLFGD